MDHRACVRLGVATICERVGDSTQLGAQLIRKTLSLTLLPVGLVARLFQRGAQRVDLGGVCLLQVR